MEWIAAALVGASLSLLAFKWYEQGWWLSLFACLAWAIVAVQSGLWALLFQQVFLIGISLYGLRGTMK